MLRHERSAPIWLFSFVDLAFLLLIAFTQIGPEFDPSSLTVGQLEMPQISTSAEPLTRSSSAPAWQLRVHPMATGPDGLSTEARARAVFELVDPDLSRNTATADNSEAPTRIDAEELAAHLGLLASRRSDKPILAPHRDSRSEDLLVAVGLLEEVWGANRAVAVVPAPAVAAGPDTRTEAVSAR